MQNQSIPPATRPTKFSLNLKVNFNRPPDQVMRPSHAIDRASEQHQRKIYQKPGGTYIRATRVTLKISGFKQTTFLVMLYPDKTPYLFIIKQFILYDLSLVLLV